MRTYGIRSAGLPLPFRYENGYGVVASVFVEKLWDMWRFFAAGCLLLLCAAHSVWSLGEYTRTASYNDQIVVRCTGKLKGTVQLLQQNSDLWHVGQDSVDLRMSRKMFARVQGYVPECSVHIDNVEEHIKEAEAQMFPARLQEEEVWAQSVLESVLNTKASLAECQAAIENWEKARFQEGSNAWFEEYHSYDAIVMWYKRLAERHPDLVRYVESIGQSYLGVDMPAVHLTASSNSQRRKVYFQCQIHAREWISGAVCMYIADQLVSLYGSNPLVTNILNAAEIILIPFVNPDGYVYTWTHDRLWRKNRRTVESQVRTLRPCVGVDINRNFPTGWRQGGKSNPMECSEDYGGPSPASEPETQNIMNYWKSNGPIVGAIDWHSYGQLILRPWAFTKDNTNHEERIVQLGKDMVEAIKEVHGTVYTSEKSIELYQCFGIASDWFYSDDASSHNGGYRSVGYVIELRDTGGHGFVLPPDQILPTGQEIFPAVLLFAHSLLANPIPYSAHDAMVQSYKDPHYHSVYSS